MVELGLPAVIDGTYGEGGGALVRTALAMSALTLRPLRIQNVRGGTTHPGLTAEDRTLIAILQHACAAETVFVEEGSHQFSFLPTRLPVGIDAQLPLLEAHGKPGHQGGPTLLAAIAPVFAKTGRYVTLEIAGETHGQNSLSFDALAHQTLNAYRRFGFHTYADLLEAGYGRGSHGRIHLEIEPSALHGVSFRERGGLREMSAVICASDLSDGIGQRAVSHLSKLAQHSNIELDIEVVSPPSRQSGFHVSIFAEFERGFGSGSAAGARGLRTEAVVQTAFERFMQWLRTDATVDEYLADQLLVLAAIAEGPTFLKVSRLTPRVLTTVWVIKQFMPIPITVRGKEGEPGAITIKK
jgi:RNA 3'-terminal phosphate cyclase (ATP)